MTFNITQKNCHETREDHHCQLKSTVLVVINCCIFLDLMLMPFMFHIPAMDKDHCRNLQGQVKREVAESSTTFRQLCQQVMAFKDNDVTYLCFVFFALTTKNKLLSILLMREEPKHQFYSLSDLIRMDFSLYLSAALKVCLLLSCLCGACHCCVQEPHNILVKPGSINGSLHLFQFPPQSVTKSPSNGGKESHLLQGSDFGAVILCGIGALLFSLIMQKTSAPVNYTKVPCQMQMYKQPPESVASVQIISVPCLDSTQISVK